MNVRNSQKTFRMAAFVTLVLSSVLFTTACSAVTQETTSKDKPKETQSVDTTPEFDAADFAKIQSALRSLDNSLATQSKSNFGVKQSDASPQLNTSSTPPLATGNMKMGMGKGKKMMPMRGTSCMGMMCKMMMKNNSMMGTPPDQNKPDISKPSSTISLPGASSAPHVYHLGEQAFFLNYKESLELTEDQNQALVTIQSEWESTQQSLIQKRSALEASLWELTAQGLPQYDSIKETISEIEATNSTLRLQFITLVGKAVSVLTPSQMAKINTLWMAEQKDEQ